MIRRRQQSAFTLLELLVVMAILAAMLGLVTMTYSNDDQAQQRQQAINDTQLFIQHQIDQSWLIGRTLGIQVGVDTLTVYQWQSEGWKETEHTFTPDLEGPHFSLFKATNKQTLSKQTLSKQTLSEQGEAILSGMDLVFLASGEYTPFELQLKERRQDSFQGASSMSVTGDGVNVIQIAP